jgi:hypothetical protein
MFAPYPKRNPIIEAVPLFCGPPHSVEDSTSRKDRTLVSCQGSRSSSILPKDAGTVSLTGPRGSYGATDVKQHFVRILRIVDAE